MPETLVSKYPFVLVTVVYRKEGWTPEQFRDHAENIYMPMFQKIAGKAFPLTWTRRYQVGEGEGPMGVSKVLLGTDYGMEWDCMGEMTFADELHCQQFIAWLHSDLAEPVLEEEGKFAIAEKSRLFVMRREVTTGDATRAVA